MLKVLKYEVSVTGMKKEKKINIFFLQKSPNTFIKFT